MDFDVGKSIKSYLLFFKINWKFGIVVFNGYLEEYELCFRAIIKKSLMKSMIVNLFWFWYIVRSWI